MDHRFLELSGKTDECNLFTEQLLFYFDANSITYEDKQQAILLSVCWTTMYNLLKMQMLVAPTNLMSKSLFDLVSLVQENQPKTIRHHVFFLPQ